MKLLSIFLILTLVFLSISDFNENKENAPTNKIEQNFFNQSSPPDSNFINKIYLEMFSLPNEYNVYKNTSKEVYKIYSKGKSYLIDSNEEKNLLTYISHEDIEWMKTQEEKSTFTFNENSFVYKCLISFDTLKGVSGKGIFSNFWNVYPVQYREEGYNALSLPLFSKDKKYFVIYLICLCGSKCGRDALLLYEKIDGNYKYKETIMSGVF
ncbi:MAG: hypothetical protein JSS63_11675 [Bacteroidetes bacterium]|nr:hypothetical protein [Bacteroidota bacterium]